MEGDSLTTSWESKQEEETSCGNLEAYKNRQQQKNGMRQP